MYYSVPVFSTVDFVVCDEGCVLFPLPLLAVLNEFHSECAERSLQLPWALQQSRWNEQVGTVSTVVSIPYITTKYKQCLYFRSTTFFAWLYTFVPAT